MLRPTIFANITLASHATHVGLFAQLSHLPHSHFRIGGRLFRNADLTVLRTPTDFHSRAACWPFIGLRLLLHPPVGMSHTTSHLVEAEEAHFAVARYPVVLPNIRRPITHFAVRLRIFPVTPDCNEMRGVNC